jgi:hypothetical protein
LHVVEAEVLDGVLEALVVIEDNNGKYNGIRRPHWNPIVMREKWKELSASPICTRPVLMHARHTHLFISSGVDGAAAGLEVALPQYWHSSGVLLLICLYACLLHGTCAVQR